MPIWQYALYTLYTTPCLYILERATPKVMALFILLSPLSDPDNNSLLHIISNISNIL